MAIKVLHLDNEALLGRYPHKRVKELFSQHNVDYVFAEEVGKEIVTDSVRLVQYCNENNYSWIFWNWEKHDPKRYEAVFDSNRSFKMALLGHEQPQVLPQLRRVQQYFDFVITTAPTYKYEVDGFLPFGIHTYFFEERRKRFEEKQNRILISGSYRHSRGQFFEWLLKEQPFSWPVYLYTPNLENNMVEKDEMRKIVSRYPKFVYKCASNHRSYIPGFLRHLNNHKIFLDFTTNSTNYLKFHEDIDEIMKVAENLKGGYCPERVLDALWLGAYSWCFYDKAVEYCLEDKVGYYKKREELVEQVEEHIRDSLLLKSKSEKSSHYCERYTTERVIKHLSDFFGTGRLIEL